MLGVIACDRRETDRPSPEPSSSASSAPRVAAAQPVRDPETYLDDVEIATRWLVALRDGSASELAENTQYPIEIHDDAGACKDQTASGPEQLQRVLSCLRTNANLMGLMLSNDSAAVEPLADVHMPAWFQRWRVAQAPNMKIVTGHYNRSDAQATLDLWVADGGVRGVWKSGLDGSAEIAIATEWLDALRNRDIERLGRVTSYPLEIRDTQRDATCGKRMIESADILATSIDCLMKSDLLHRALVDSPASGFTAHRPSQSLANWVEPWWRESEHQGLQRVWTMVATTEGYEFDFQMLVAPEGVRVVWKLGSFESRD